MGVEFESKCPDLFIALIRRFPYLATLVILSLSACQPEPPKTWSATYCTLPGCPPDSVRISLQGELESKDDSCPDEREANIFLLEVKLSFRPDGTYTGSESSSSGPEKVPVYLDPATCQVQ